MNAITDALTSAIVAAIPVLMGAAVAAAVAWLVRLKERALVHDEVTASAIRQAQAAHGGDTAQAEQAAVDELRRMSPKVAPKDAVTAVLEMVDAQRAVRASKAPSPITPDDAPIDPEAPGI